MNKRLLNKQHSCWIHYNDKGILELTKKPTKCEGEMQLGLNDEVIVVTERNMELKQIPKIEIKGWNDYSIWGNLPNGMAMTFILVDIIYLMNAY